MNFKVLESDAKLRGGYYTPLGIAEFLARFALNGEARSILEPSCGDGVFIKAIGSLSRRRVDITGIEIDPYEAVKAQNAADLGKVNATVVQGDFLTWAVRQLDEGTQFDAVAGNPPYIRYQYLEKADQAVAEDIFKRFGLPFTRHTNAWVPFVIASLALLRPGGRLAMVIPSEILHVLHAASLRKYLLAECDRILVIDPNELLFTEALQGTVLLLVEKNTSPAKKSRGVAVMHAPSNGFLADDPDKHFAKQTYVSGDVLNGKWMKVLLSSVELDLFERCKANDKVRTFRDIAQVDVGIVTGANKFFLVDDDTVNRYGLHDWVRPMFGRSDHCAGVIYDEAAHAHNRKRGLPTNFVMLGDGPEWEMTDSIREYIREGERQKLHSRYKCRIRSPWYKVPSIYATEVGMLKRSHNFPGLIHNKAGAYTTDTAYRIRALSTPADKLVFCFVNSMTALSAELEGRHYGGGVLELVPSEIEKLLIPIPESPDFDLRALDDEIRSGADADSILVGQDDTILAGIGLGRGERQIVHEAWQRMRFRRHRMMGEDKAEMGDE
jgi:adenine-specific DNA-methyltransferase